MVRNRISEILAKALRILTWENALTKINKKSTPHFKQRRDSFKLHWSVLLSFPGLYFLETSTPPPLQCLGSGSVGSASFGLSGSEIRRIRIQGGKYWQKIAKKTFYSQTPNLNCWKKIKLSKSSRNVHDLNPDNDHDPFFSVRLNGS